MSTSELCTLYVHVLFEEEKLTECFVFCFLFFLDLWAGNNNNNKKKKKKKKEKKWVTICTVVAIVVIVANTVAVFT